MSIDEKQIIKEMAEIIGNTQRFASARVGAPASPTMIATDLFDKGYRRTAEMTALFTEVMQALEKGIAVAKKEVSDRIPPELRDICANTGELYAGRIALAICEVFKRYAKEGGD